jgi:hypothetical protein
MTTSEIATEIHTELGSPSTLTTSAIQYWVKTNVGTLNNVINTSFTLNDSEEIEQTICGVITAIAMEEAAILKKLYSLHYYDQQIRTNLGAASSDSVIEVESDGQRVKKINKTRIADHLANVKKQESGELNKMIHFYKTNKSSPRQVAGDDTVEGQYSRDNSSSSFNRLDY